MCATLGGSAEFNINKSRRAKLLTGSGISGLGGLVKTGDGILNIQTVNTYAGFYIWLNRYFSVL